MANIDSFYEELSQEISSTADSQEIFKEEAFFSKISELLMSAGEFDEALYSPFHPERGEMRVDGYCGDPRDTLLAGQSDSATLSLIVLDYSQEPTLSSLTNKTMETDFRRLERYLLKSLDLDFRNKLESSDPGFGLADLISTRWEMISRVNLYLLTNKQLSQRIQGKQRTELAGKEIVYNVWDIIRIKNLIESGQERERLFIDFNDLPTGPIPALLASDPRDKRRVFLTALPGEDLARIYDRWGTRLLEANVRVFLQARSNVNKGIKRTLENEPELFFSFNNGITATAESVETRSDGSGLVITGLENLQIVNGGQTTASVYAAFKKKLPLNRVYVQMKLSEVNAEDAQTLVPRISEYANSQNKVSTADFFANHPYHVQIEKLSKRVLAPMKKDSFIQTKWYYERARGSYRDAQAYLSPAEKRKFLADYPKNQTFTKTDLAKYLMVWTDKGYMVNRGAQKNFAEFAKEIAEAWDKNKDRFNEYYFKCLIAKKIIFDATGKIVQSRDWYEAGGYRSQHVVLTIGVLSSSIERMSKSLDFISIWNSQDISEPLKHALEQAADAAHEVLMNPDPGYRNISEWAKQEKCWDEINSLDIDWNSDFLAVLKSQNDERDLQRESAREQHEINGIEAQMVVVDQGAQFWKKVLDWCIKEEEGTEKEISILRTAASLPRKIPSDKQSVILVNFMNQLRTLGCPYILKSPHSTV
jgi:hypothetical protein